MELDKNSNMIGEFFVSCFGFNMAILWKGGALYVILKVVK